MGNIDGPVADYRVVSLFSGVGGMDLGSMGGFTFLGKRYKRLSTKVVFATDFDSKAAQIYDKNFDLPLNVADIRDLKSKSIPNHEILTGGFPCQSFSVAATNPVRLGYKDDRGQLFFEMVRVLREKKPQVFIAENVKGIFSANRGEAFPLIIAEFRSAGYHVKWQVLNSVDFGVPQKRQRVFIVGFRNKHAHDEFRFPQANSRSHATIRSILEDQVAEDFYFSERAVLGMQTTKNSKLMNKGRAQPIDEPCNTVGAHLAKVSLNSTDPVFLQAGRYRMFTPREVARIQSFPEKFQLFGSKSVIYRGLGNAVAPVVMWHVTKAVIDVLDLVADGRTRKSDREI